MIDLEKFIGGLHGWFGEQIAPLVERVKLLEQTKPKDGKDGADGKDGQDGTSVPVEEVKAMVADAVAAIPPATNGKDGESIPVAEVERMVADAVSKAVGAIRMPQDGAPGRDAAHLEILPAIDEAKNYPRGTYAKHAGGLWKSYETTAGMRGWECIVEGVSGLQVIQEERGFSMEVRMSSGTVTKQAMTLPVMIYKGIYKEGNVYEPGDTVTWGGSLWHCDTATRDKPGVVAAVKCWTLCAQRGRDGKDGQNGKDLVSGVKLS